MHKVVWNTSFVSFTHVPNQYIQVVSTPSWFFGESLRFDPRIGPDSHKGTGSPRENWCFTGGLDGSLKSGEANQLRLVVENPIINRVSAPSKRWLALRFQPSTLVMLILFTVCVIYDIITLLDLLTYFYGTSFLLVGERLHHRRRTKTI